jgi:cytochrome d ubiquinol oxidase subunit II
VIGVALVAYAVTGGADLGVGLWHFFASGPRKTAQRKALREAIAPIWEANHVWLIFVIVLLFSAFPHAFSALCIALHVPIALGLIGIVFRGSAYTFRAYGIRQPGQRDDWDRVFAWASAITPVCFGLVVGGVSSGEIRIQDGEVTTGYFAGWTTPFALSVGVFSLSLFGMLSAVYLAYETRGELAEDFRRRAFVMEVVSGVLAAITFVLASFDAPLLYRNLSASSWAGPLQGVTAGFACLTLVLLHDRRLGWARFSAAAQVAMVVVGWGFAMRGHFLLPDMNLARASAHPELLPALALVVALGSVILLPSLAYLYWVFKRPND